MLPTNQIYEQLHCYMFSVDKRMNPDTSLHYDRGDLWALSGGDEVLPGIRIEFIIIVPACPSLCRSVYEDSRCFSQPPTLSTERCYPLCSLWTITPTQKSPCILEANLKVRSVPEISRSIEQSNMVDVVLVTKVEGLDTSDFQKWTRASAFQIQE